MERTIVETRQRKTDIRLFAILIPFIAAFNYYLTYTNIKLNAFLIITFVIDTVQGYLAVWGVRVLIIYFDKKLPFHINTAKRIVIQVITTSIAGILIIILLTELVSWIARGESVPIKFYQVDIFIIGIWFLVVNGIYIGLHFYYQLKQVEATNEKSPEKSKVLVKQGKQDLLLDLNDVAGFYVEGEYVVVCHASGKKYYLDQSLDRVEETVSSSTFFRLNRQILIHRQSVVGFKRVENGKLHIQISNEEFFPGDIVVSRLKAPAFKRWFQPE